MLYLSGRARLGSIMRFGGPHNALHWDDRKDSLGTSLDHIYKDFPLRRKGPAFFRPSVTFLIVSHSESATVVVHEGSGAAQMAHRLWCHPCEASFVNTQCKSYGVMQISINISKESLESRVAEPVIPSHWEAEAGLQI